ncbi:alpha/beta hydrolase [Sandaracinobacter neustonicus]|uniref:Alpha/beta hydrolase n=1 Tax=Sandaracinobacter neustonicus TaxID=1715348 RepID=A0A501XIP7_9SPHN|nr:alpha/beta fold hydrolase [Sandaracinobacter neustonicus]TPE60538.1 alpha/beta hydrolase [Sandaracinobacter neustonicus]
MEFHSFDGTRLHVTELGEGPPVLLLHGLFSSAETNWIRYGTAKRLAEGGYRLIMPDFRGHGQSDAPEGADYWPADVLARDIEALVAHLGLGGDFVLGGYSLGARTVARLLARGMQPRAAIFAGMGLRGLVKGGDRAGFFVRMIEGRGTWARGTPEFTAEAFMKSSTKNPDCIVHLLNGQQSTSDDVIAGFALPSLVVCGAQDQDNGSAPDLAALLPDGRYAEIPGTHMGSVTRPELGAAMLDFLKGL